MKIITTLLLVIQFINSFALDTLTVSNATELIGALGNDRVIILSKGEYDITYSSELDSSSAFFNKNNSRTNYDYTPSVIDNINHLKLIGLDSVKIIVTDEYSWVANFYNCTDLTFINIEFGHKVRGICEGGALRLFQCNNILMDKVGLYGCGTTGLELRNVSDFFMKDSKIYKCTYHLCTFLSSKNIRFQNSIFEKSGEFNMFSFTNLTNVQFDTCQIRNNKQKKNPYNKVYLIQVESYNDIIKFNNCIIKENDYLTLTNSTKSLTFHNCTFLKNKFDKLKETPVEEQTYLMEEEYR